MLKLVYGIGATVVTGALLYLLARIDPFVVSLPAWAAMPGAILFTAGLALRLWATWEFWSRGRGTPLPPVLPTRLVTTGPYRHSRNPLSVGIMLMISGVALLYGSPVNLVVLVGLLLFLHWGLPGEEKRLESRYGDDYRRYRRRVRRWL